MAILILVFLCGVTLVALSQAVVVVPEQRVYLLERFGKFDRTLGPGLHFLIPGVERVAFRHSLEELAVDIAEQLCITRDDVQVEVGGIVYIRIRDPQRACYEVRAERAVIARSATRC